MHGTRGEEARKEERKIACTENLSPHNCIIYSTRSIHYVQCCYIHYVLYIMYNAARPRLFPVHLNTQHAHWPTKLLLKHETEESSIIDELCVGHVQIWSEGRSGGLESRQAVSWASRECRCQSEGAVEGERWERERGRKEGELLVKKYHKKRISQLTFNDQPEQER